jgi:hypothetical protein
MTVRPEVGQVESLVAAIDRQEADLYGLNGPKKSEVAAAVVCEAISDKGSGLATAGLLEIV